MTKSANRKDLARRISNKTGYFIKDIEEILESEEDVISDLVKEGYTKIKHHKLYQIEIKTRASKQAYDGLNKRYFILPERQYIEFKPLVQLENAINYLNKDDE